MIRKLILNFFIERPGAKKTVPQWQQQFEQSGRHLLERAEAVDDSDMNRKVMSHIIGIERWGQSRLKVGLGEPFIKDEYNDYRPARDADWETLKGQFAKTRSETTALLGQIEAKSVDTSTKVVHNQHGRISLKGWMRYLDMHAGLESKRLK